MNYSTCPQQCDGLTMNCSLTSIESSLCTLEEPFQGVKGGSLDLIYSYDVMGDANRMSKCEKKIKEQRLLEDSWALVCDVWLMS